MLSIRNLETGEIANIVTKQLVNEYHYPINSIQSMRTLSHGKARYLLDLVVQIENNVEILVEIKKIEELSQHIKHISDIIDIVKPKYVMITNGIDYKYYRTKEENFEIMVEEIPDISPYRSSLEKIGEYKEEDLVQLDKERFTQLLFRHTDVLRGEHFGAINSIKYILTLYAAKRHDELVKTHRFQAHVNETARNISSRIITIINDFYNENLHILSENIPLTHQTISEITYDIQKYSFINSTPIFKEFLPIILNLFETSNINTHMGEYSTPITVSDFIMDVLEPKQNELLLDPASGVGGFLQLAADRGSKVIGFDISRDTCQISNLILYLSGYKGKCYNLNSLTLEAQNHISPGSVDIIATAPPLGITISDYSAKDFKLSSGKKRIRSDILFLELTINYLKDDGRAAIILHPSVLFDSAYHDVRKFLLQNAKLNAIIYLENKAFQPSTNVNACIVFFEKKPRGTTTIDDVFFGRIETNEDYQPIYEKLKLFLRGEDAQESNNIVITRIKTAENLDWSYIKGSIYRGIIETQDYYYLEQIADITTGISLNRLEYNDATGEYAYINVKNVDDGLLDISDTIKVSLDKKYDKYIVNKGDIIFSRAGSVGKVALVTKDEKIVAGNNLMVIKLREKSLSSAYILGYLMSNYGREQIEMYTTGSAIDTINSSNLGKVMIPIFSEEQMRYATNKIEGYLDLRAIERKTIEEIQERKIKQLKEINRSFERSIK